MPLTGSGTTNSPLDITVPGAWSPISLAVDWIGNILYVVDSLGQKIDVFDFEGVHHAIVLSSNLSSPVDIGLDPTVGFMFITDNNRLLRARMDGTFLVSLVTDSVYKASGVTVDITTKRVYWSDVLLDYIETVTYAGEGRQQVIRGPINVPMPSRIATFERTIYWSDGSKQGIFSVDKFNGTDSKKSIYTMTNVQGKEPKALRVVHELLQPPARNPCAQGNECEQLCIVTATEEDNLNQVTRHYISK